MATCRRSPSSRLLCVAVAMGALAFTLAPIAAQAGILDPVESQAEGTNGVSGLHGVLAVIVSPDGRDVYAAAANDDAVTAFRRDPASGTLTQTQLVKDGVDGVDGLAYASALALSPDGKHLYVTGSTDNAVAVFGRDATTGALTFIEAQKEGVAGVDGLKFARSVALSPDGAFVYVAGQTDDAIAVFKRNGLTGWLSFVEVQREGMNGVTGIAGPLAITISPDGANLYLASGDQSAVAVFKRDSATGHLRQADLEMEGGNDFGLAGTHCVTVSPDGAYVYATGQTDNAIATFSRNKRTGTLAFSDVLVQGLDGVDGMTGALWVTLSPDGSKAFVASTHDNSLVVFTRDAGTGALHFAEKQNGGAFARGVAVSPDGKSVYTAGASSNAIYVFRVNP
jgi:6-phosphogluconolactonase (cycloisomerase 2 family)